MISHTAQHSRAHTHITNSQHTISFCTLSSYSIPPPDLLSSSILSSKTLSEGGSVTPNGSSRNWD
jgi:hypothetical protein